MGSAALRVGGVALALAQLSACGSLGADFEPGTGAVRSDSLPDRPLTVVFQVSCTRCTVRHSTGTVHTLERVEGTGSFTRSVSPNQQLRRPWARLEVEPREDEDVIRDASITVEGEVRAESGEKEPGEAVTLQARLGT